MPDTPTRVLTRVQPNPILRTLDVTITADGSPFGYIMRMDQRQREDGSLELTCVGIGVEQPAGNDLNPAGDDREPVTQAAARELVDRFAQFERIARDAVALLLDRGEHVSVPPRTRRKLSPEFLHDVTRRHADYTRQGRPATATLARAERVSTGTVKYWLRQAKAAGIKA